MLLPDFDIISEWESYSLKGAFTETSHLSCDHAYLLAIKNQLQVRQILHQPNLLGFLRWVLECLLSYQGFHLPAKKDPYLLRFGTFNLKYCMIRFSHPWDVRPCITPFGKCRQDGLCLL